MVFYESWQMECCGIAFSLGDTVKWLVRKAEQVTASVDIGRIDYCYEAHSGNGRIYLFQREKHKQLKFCISDIKLMLVPVSGETVEAEQVEGILLV